MMQEFEVENSHDAAFFIANDVVNEYHEFPVVQRADIGGANCLFILINDKWFKVELNMVSDPDLLMKLEELASHA
jgi:hypothetical protein